MTVEDIYGSVWRMVTVGGEIQFEWKETNSPSATWKQHPEHLIPSSIVEELNTQHTTGESK